MTPRVTGGATYGDLLDAAARQVALAAVGLAVGPMTGPAAAGEAVAAYRGLLGAIHAHTRALFGTPARLEAVAASAAPDPRDAAAVRLVRELTRFARPRGRAQDTVEGPGMPWGAAAISLRAATDLLATHHDRDGVARTPEALRLEERTVRAVGLAGIGDLACTVLAAERDLGLRAGQAGMSWDEVDRLLPHMGSLIDTARALAAPIKPGTAHRWLREVAVAWPRVRTGDPSVELGDRLLRLRRVAWQLARAPHVGISTLSDFAAAAVTFHSHALMHLGSETPTSASNLVRNPLQCRLLEARAAWSQVHLQSREMRTAAPSARVVRADTLAIRELCRTLMPLDPDTNRSADTELRAVINGGSRLFAEIAGWNACVLAELDATGHLYLPARSLTGAEVTERPHLVVAKLRGDMVRAPHGQIRQLAQSYRLASVQSGNGLTPRDERAPHALSKTAPLPPTLNVLQLL